MLKPASLTPLIGERIQAVFERAGLPEGLVRTVHGGGAVGQALVESSAAKIFFTGSVEVGRRVGEECAQRMKGSVLELGGKDPMIVCADADLPNAISGASGAASPTPARPAPGSSASTSSRGGRALHRRRGRGRRAAAPGRPARLGHRDRPDGLGEQYDLVKELVDDAVAAGAKLHCGGAEPALLHGPRCSPA